MHRDIDGADSGVLPCYCKSLRLSEAAASQISGRNPQASPANSAGSPSHLTRHPLNLVHKVGTIGKVGKGGFT
jgi:hypothetical protein